MPTSTARRPKSSARGAPAAAPSDRPLSVLWLSHLVPHPGAGGASQRSYHLLCQAASRHRVHVVALHRPRLLSADLLSQATTDLSRRCTLDVVPLARDRSALHRLWVATMGLWRPQPYESIWLESGALHRRLKMLARTTRYDVVHADTLGLLPYADCFPDAAAVLTHHDIQSVLFTRRAVQEGRTLRGLYSRFEARKLERAEREVAPRVALNLTVSALDAERLNQMTGACNTVVVPNGVDVDYFRPFSGDDTAGLVFAASFDTIPNQDAVRYFLGEIWPVLVADDPRRRITFVGRGPGRDLMRAAADRRVTVTGPVADVRPFIAAATVYVCPLRVGGGTRLKVLDALAMGKALVATRLSVEGLGLTPGVHYLEAETPLQFLQQVRRVESDPHLRHELGRAGRQLVEGNYSWGEIGATLDRAYRDAVAIGAGASESGSPASRR